LVDARAGREIRNESDDAEMQSTPESLDVGIAMLAPDGTVYDENATWQGFFGSVRNVRPNYFDACTSEQAQHLRGVIDGRRKVFTCLQQPSSAEGPILLVALARSHEPPTPVILLQVNMAGLLTFDMMPEASFTDEPAFGIGLIVRTIEQTMQRLAPKSAMASKKVVRVSAAEADQRDAVAQLLQLLTPRQRDVLRLVGMGKSNTEIGSELDITTNTAKLHVASIQRRLDLDNRMQAVALGARIGSV
jgi:DNA-binding NarL/FixJ family response regulator